MTGDRTDKLPRRTLAIAAIGAVLVAGVAAAIHFSRGEEATVPGVGSAGEGGAAGAGNRGNGSDQAVVRLAGKLRPDLALNSISYFVKSAADALIAQGTITLKPDASMFSHPIQLPVAKGDSVTFMGHSSAGGINRTIPLGQRTFDVVGGSTATVSLDNDPSGGTGAGVTAGGDAGINDNLSACRKCQQDSKAGICDPPNVTATSNMNPTTGEQTGVGWGCGTLPTPAAQAACSALLHCLNANECGSKEQNPVLNCYCGHASPEACIGGEGITGACVAAYQAAAKVSPDSPGANAGGPELSKFIATNASDPITPVGLANNIRHCGLQAGCDICGAL